MSTKTPQGRFSAPFKTPTSNGKVSQGVFSASHKKKKSTPTILTGLSQTSYVTPAQREESHNSLNISELGGEDWSVGLDAADLGFSTQQSCASEANAIDAQTFILQHNLGMVEPKKRKYAKGKGACQKEAKSIAQRSFPFENPAPMAALRTSEASYSVLPEKHIDGCSNQARGVSAPGQNESDVYNFDVSPETQRRYVLKKRTGRANRDATKKQVLRLIAKMREEILYWRRRDEEIDAGCLRVEQRRLAKEAVLVNGGPTISSGTAVVATSSTHPDFRKEYVLAHGRRPSVETKGYHGYVERRTTSQWPQRREP